MEKSLDYDSYLDRVYGGWVGKCLGGAAGAPVEGIKKQLEIEDFTAIMRPDLPNDDLDLQLLWLETLERKGPYLTSVDLADAWLEKCWYPFNEYGYFLKNYRRGIRPPLSGSFNNTYYNEGEGCPIRSEIWGFVFPGRPELAVKFARLDGVLDHTTNSVWAEQLLAALESMLFFENDLTRLLEMGLECVPKESKLTQCLRFVQDYHQRHPLDWAGARLAMLGRFGHPDFTNCIQNLGIVTIALLYGQGDLKRSLTIGVNCGYDTDSTCATIGAILGGLQGYHNLSTELTKLIQEKFEIGINLTRRNHSIKALAEDTCRVGIGLAKYFDSKAEISNLPPELVLPNWPQPNKAVSLEVNYVGLPAIGTDFPLEVKTVITNPTRQTFDACLEFENMPQGWLTEDNRRRFWLFPGQSISFSNVIYITGPLVWLANTNILRAVLQNSSGEELASQPFGIAGSSLWKAYGPFFEPLEVEENSDYPSAHGPASILPPVEAMANNAVYLDTQYLPENPIELEAVTPAVLLNAPEDLIPLEDYFTIQGQACFYLEQTVFSPEDRELWAVIGNNDGYRLWVNGNLVQQKDEIRLWTPFNNYIMIKLNQGPNKITLKLLRRTERLCFSLGLRRYEGKHWHRNEWYTDFASLV